MAVLRLALVLVALTTVLACADEGGLEPQAQAEKFLDRIVAGEIAKAYDSLWTDSHLYRTKKEEMDYVCSQTAAAMPLYGEFFGKELLSETSYGSRIVKLKYAIFGYKLPVIWMLHFYKAPGGWEIISIRFSDQVGFLER